MIISSNAGSAAEDGTWAENPRCYCAVTNPRIQSEAARRRLTVMRHQRKLTREYQSDDRRCSLTSAALPALGIPRPIARLPSSAEPLDKRFHISSKYAELVIDRVVITTGPSAYRRPDGIVILPLALLGS